MPDKKLHLGKVTTKELAEWFGISPGSFRNKKQTKLKELADYCSFESVYGGIIINYIYIEKYIKPTSTYAFVKSVFSSHWHKSGYDTVARVGSEIYHAYKDKELKNYTESTIKEYTRKAREELYGHVYKDDRGSQGICYLAPVKANKWEEAILLTTEELEIYNKHKKAIYYDEEKANLEIAMLEGSISQAEYNKAMILHEQKWKEAALERRNKLMGGSRCELFSTGTKAVL